MTGIVRPPGHPPPAVRFGADGLDPQKTHAKAITLKVYAQGSEVQRSLWQIVEEKLAQRKAAFFRFLKWGGLACALLPGTLTALTALGYHQHRLNDARLYALSKTTYTTPQEREQLIREFDQAQFARFAWGEVCTDSSILFAISTPILLFFLIPGFSMTFTGYRKALAVARRHQADRLLVKALPDPQAQALCQVLSRRIDQACALYADHFQTLYRQHPELRKELESLFGGEDRLPGPQDLKILFEYIAYQQLVDEKALLGLKKLPAITQQEYLEKVYVLLRTGMVLGNPYQFLSEEVPTSGAKKKSLLRITQAFNREVQAKVDLMALEIEGEVRQLAQLVEKKAEIERHLAFAQKALATTSLSVLDRKGEITQIEEAIAVFTQCNAQLEAALHQSLTPEMIRPQTQEALLALVDDALPEMMTRLNAALSEHTKEQTFKTALQQALTVNATSN